MANKIGDIAKGNLNQNINQAALKQFVGPVQSTQADPSLTGQTAQSALAALQKAQQQSAVPNPTTSTGGGAMTQNANGINASGGNVMAKQQVPSSDGLIGVRAAAENAGIKNVGWDAGSGTVTFDGKGYIKPTNVSDDGTAFTDRQTIQSAINQFYKDSGTPLAGADSYVGQQLGVKGAVSWSDGNLMIGGQIVPTVYVDDNGTAYARQSDLDKAIASYRKTSGITGNQEVYNDWKDTYGSDIKKALAAVMNRREWSYNPENDPAYQTYREQYTREGNRAMQDAFAGMAASTGGYGSSAAMTAAGQQKNYYMRQLADRIPELMQNDYSRYLGEQQLRRQALDSIMGVANDDYDKQYQANRDSVADENEANYQSWLRSKDARDYNRDVEVQDRQWPYQEALLKDQITQSGIDTERYGENADLDIAAKQMQNWQQQAQKVLTQLQYSGNLDATISAEAAATLGVRSNESGEYPTFREILTSYAQAEAIPEWVIWEQAGRQQKLDTWRINNGLGI